MSVSIFKVLTAPQWEQFESTGSYAGTPIDLQDGFIHLSIKEQVEGVISRYYSGQRPLYIVEFSINAFGDAVRWELASNGEKFPHVYGRALAFKDVLGSLVRD